jgi:predicted amino acid dehydrogenase
VSDRPFSGSDSSDPAEDTLAEKSLLAAAITQLSREIKKLDRRLDENTKTVQQHVTEMALVNERLERAAGMETRVVALEAFRSESAGGAKIWHLGVGLFLSIVGAVGAAVAVAAVQPKPDPGLASAVQALIRAVEAKHGGVR